MNGVALRDGDQLLEGLEDEDKRDERGETLLRKSGDVSHEGAEIKRDHEDQDDPRPNPDPKPERQVVQTIVSVKIKIKIKNQIFVSMK